MCPVMTDAGLFAFIVPSPKQRDLLRDGRYALHSFPREDNEDAFYCAGRASLVEDRALRSELGAVFVAERVRSPSPIRGGPPVRVHAWFLSSHPYDGARRSEPRTPGVGRRVT